MFKKLFGISFLSIIGSFMFANLASAQTFNIWAGTGKNGVTCNVAPGGCGLCDGYQVAINIVNGVTTLAIAVTVGMVVYGAIRLMLSAGSEQMMKDAKGTITSAIIGLVIVLCGWLIVNTFIHFISGNIDFPWAALTCSA